jgi:hypothetical protein
MKKLLTVFILSSLLSSMYGEAQVVVGGSGGWDDFKESKTTFQLNLLTKKLFRNYSQNLSKCDDEVKPVKIKTWQEFSLSLIREAIKTANLKEITGSDKDTDCPKNIPTHNSIPENKALKNGNCAITLEEISVIKNLVGAKNFKAYLKSKHQLDDAGADELIELLEHIIKDPELKE